MGLRLTHIHTHTFIYNERLTHVNQIWRQIIIKKHTHQYTRTRTRQYTRTRTHTLEAHHFKRNSKNRLWLLFCGRGSCVGCHVVDIWFDWQKLICGLSGIQLKRVPSAQFCQFNNCQTFCKTICMKIFAINDSKKRITIKEMLQFCITIFKWWQSSLTSCDFSSYQASHKQKQDARLQANAIDVN